MKKRFRAMLMACMMVFTCTTVAFAATAQEKTAYVQNVGVSEHMPVNPEVSGRSTSMPDKSNVYTNGTSHSVSGWATNTDLYTNKCFKGVKSIYSYTENNSTSKLTVRARYYATIGVLYAGSYTVNAGGIASSTFSDLDSSKYYFIQYSYPCDFSGTVKGNA